MMSDAQDVRVPEIIRRTGRIESLAEFQDLVRARSTSYDEDPPQIEFHKAASPYPIRTNDKTSSDVADTICTNGILRRTSTASLFGSLSRGTKRSERRKKQLKVIVFLVIIGVIGAPIIYGMKRYDLLLKLVYLGLIEIRLDSLILSARANLTIRMGHTSWQYAFWTGHALLFTFIGLMWTRISSAATGSGVSQMKSILTGIDPGFYLPGYFSTTTLIAKMGGLICAVGAGLVVGTEGANVHIMSIITHHLLKIKVFRDLGQRLNMRLQLLAAACALGVAATFSSPIGGVLFSMEVTSTYYLTSNYMKAFISSVSGAMVLKVLPLLSQSSNIGERSSIFLTTYPFHPYKLQQLVLYAVLGICVGLIACFMLWAVRFVAVKRKEIRASRSRLLQFCITYLDPMIVAFFCATATFIPGEFARLGTLSDITSLFSVQQLPESWRTISVYYSCGVLCAVYVIFLPLCITLKLPTGIWLPTFIAGAAFGRLFGELVNTLLPAWKIIPGTYSLVGASAFAAGATKTVSVAVITLEITGAMQLMLPIFLGVLMSISVVNLLNESSVYDSLLAISGLPYLPALDIDANVAVCDVVEPITVHVTRYSTISKMLLAIHRMPGQDIPVLENEESRMLLGVVSTNQLREYVKKFYWNHGLPDLEADLGEAPSANVGIHTKTFDIFFRGGGGLNGHMSYDQLHNALKTKTAPPSGKSRIPFILDDNKMIELMSKEWYGSKKELLNEHVRINQSGGCAIKPVPITISSSTPLDDLHMIFTMFRCDHCFVCDQGALVGVVTTKALLQAGREISNEQIV